ncbi:hypothetical protein FRC08_010416 [Ceratobasidium sp. 394]|nr:hypothetical protein FRC08_010416 [Ceratobasidium sp. 394]
MPVPSTLSTPDEYIGMFVTRGPQVGHITDFALSPDGNLLLSSTATDLVLTDTRTGRPMVWIKIGTNNKVSALGWLNSKKCFVGCHNGHIYVAQIGEYTITTTPIVSISYAFQDIQKTIKVLRWDATDKLLAIGYEDGCSIWKSNGKKWKVHDRITIPHDNVTGVCTMAFYSHGSKRYLFIGGGFGYVTWLGPQQVSFFTNDKRFHNIGKSALSPDNKFLAATTFDGKLLIWPVKGAILGPDHSTRTMETGEEYRSLYPFLPVTITPGGLAAVGTQVGQVDLSRTDGTAVDDFYFDDNWSVLGILAYRDRIYVAYMGPVGAIMIVGYADNKNTFFTFKKLYESKIATVPQTIKATWIDLDLIPKSNVAGVVMQTGRADLKPQAPAEVATEVDNVEPDRPNSCLHGCAYVFFVIVSGLAVVLIVLLITSDYALLRMLVFLAPIVRIVDELISPSFVLNLADVIDPNL